MVGIKKSESGNNFGNVLFAEANYFDFRMKDAIVRRQNERGQEFFINSGATIQKGIEFLLESKNFNLKNDFLSYFKFRFSEVFTILNSKIINRAKQIFQEMN